MRKATIRLVIHLYIYCGLLIKFFIKEADNRRRALSRNATFFGRVGMKILRINLHIKGVGIPEGNEGCLIVCNHMSYLDILILASIRPFVFISSVDTREQKLVGLMSELGGSYFVERRSLIKIRSEIKEVGELLKKGFCVVLFPEGTTTDGSTVLPFKAPFIESARKAGMPVLPLCLKYDSVDGKAFSDENKDDVCWYGDMEFEPHFNGLFKLKSIEATLSVMGAVETADSNSKELSEELYERISSAYFTA